MPAEVLRAAGVTTTAPRAAFARPSRPRVRDAFLAVVVFGAAFPAAMAFAAATNYIETRTDGYKLLHDYRRVVPSRVRHPDTVLIRTSRNSFIFKV